LLSFALNADSPADGIRRRQAQGCIEQERSGDRKRLQLLEPKFRQVMQTDRANAVAVPESQSQRVLATLKPIDPA